MLYPVSTYPAFTENLFAYTVAPLRSTEIKFTYVHSSTLVSPILEKSREFRHGWEFEKEKEPRSSAHRKFREGKENRFQMLDPFKFF